MITGIGTDLVEIARVQKAIGRSSFLEKVYTEKEQELIGARANRAATNFAAKEAVAKALGCGFAGIAPVEIEVLRQPSGMPYVVLHGRAKAKAEAVLSPSVKRIALGTVAPTVSARRWATCLFMHKEELREPQPAMGMPASSKTPCTVPSSPFLPCRIGSAQSM